MEKLPPSPSNGPRVPQSIYELIDAMIAEQREGQEGIRPLIIRPRPMDLLLQKQVEQEVERLRDQRHFQHALEHGGELRFKVRPEDVTATIVRNSQRADDLAMRHNTHLAGPRFFNAVLGYHNTRNPQFLDAMEKLRRDAKERGLFLFSYDKQKMHNRLVLKYPCNADVPTETPQYVVSETGGGHPDRRNPLYDQRIWAADCQIALAAPVQGAKWVVDSFKPNEEVDNGTLRTLLEGKPWSVASIADITCVKQLAELGYASFAMRHSMEHVVHEVNPLRGPYPVQYFVAEIASLQGIDLPDGTKLRMGQGEFEGVPPIMNDRSLHVFDSFRSAVCTPFQTSYIRRNCRYPFVKSDKYKGYSLIVDWIGKMARVRQSDVSTRRV